MKEFKRWDVIKSDALSLDAKNFGGYSNSELRGLSKSFYEVHEELEHEKITLETVSPQIDDASRSLIESSRRKFSH